MTKKYSQIASFYYLSETNKKLLDEYINNSEIRDKLTKEQVVERAVKLYLTNALQRKQA